MARIAQLSRNSILVLARKMADEIVELQGKNVSSIVIVGAMARGEETVINNEIVSDLDIMVVTKRLDPFFRQKVMAVIERYQKLLPLKIEVGDMPYSNLRKQRSVALFEAKKTGMVIYGNAETLRNIRIDQSRDIPEWEGVRLVSNALFELLETFTRNKPPIYAISKAYLRIGEGYLIFKKRYRPTYKERFEEIKNLNDLRFVADFSKKSLISSEIKLNFRHDCGSLTLKETTQDLLRALNFFLSIFLNNFDLPLDKKFSILSYRLHDFRHSLIYFLENLRTRKLRPKLLFQEPCIVFWKEAADILTRNENVDILIRNESEMGRISRLVKDWERTPQYVLA